MTTDNRSSGANGGASGDDENTNDNKKDTVSYDTHRRLLDEKKKMQAKAEELESKLRAFEEEKSKKEREELEKQGNYQKLLEQERAEKARIENEHKQLVDTIHTARKRSAVLRNIAGKVPDPVVEALLKVDGVALKEDGTVDEDTAKLVAQEFEQNFHYVIQRDKTNGGLPNGAAPGGAPGKKMTYKEWCALPNSKEMQKHYNDVDWTTA